MRYTPLGWAKKYEFTESDLRVACDMLDVWIDSVAMVSRLQDFVWILLCGSGACIMNVICCDSVFYFLFNMLLPNHILL